MEDQGLAEDNQQDTVDKLRDIARMFKPYPITQESPLYQDPNAMIIDDDLLSSGGADVQSDAMGAHDKFDAIEHKSIGDRAFQDFEQHADFKTKEIINKLFELNLFTRRSWVFSKNLTLTSGDLITLGGDFYGLPDEPISFGDTDVVQKDRFKRAYESLCRTDSNKAHANEVLKLLNDVDRERVMIVKEVEKGNCPSVGMYKASSLGNIRYAAITLHAFFPPPAVYSRYLKLLPTNFDHFGPEARLAYQVGHAVAMETAQLAREAYLNDQSIAYELLRTAITQELFACHFWTDLFAAGHIRTPRKAIFDYVQRECNTPNAKVRAAIAGFLVKAMHDEDNRQGLEVRSLKENAWKAYGDACYFEPADRENRVQVIRAVENAIKSIFDSFVGKESTYNFEEYLPTPTENNAQPLFKIAGNSVTIRRTNYGQDGSINIVYEDNWHPFNELVRLKVQRHEEGAHHLQDCEKDPLHEELKKLNDTVSDDDIQLSIDDQEFQSCTLC